MTSPLWHLLQISDVLDLELAAALAQSVPLLAWEPQRELLPWLIAPGTEAERTAQVSTGTLPGDSSPRSTFRVRKLPLLRGFARPPMSWVAGTGSTVLERLLAQTPDPASSPLICSTPYFAAVAERWPGPVVYWLTDLIAEYAGARRRDVHRLDRRMCAAATLVCPNSRRLRSYLIETAGCEPSRVLIVPNATRIGNVLSQAPDEPRSLPVSVQNLNPPVAGVIGNLAGNMDWLLLQQLVERTPWLHWIFVGPVDMQIADRAARAARIAVMQRANTTFAGRQPYGTLANYARSFDVAVLPYRRCEPTYSGSSTRFYEHLAACRPILATRGLEELQHKEPLLDLFDTADEGVDALEQLRAKNFNDGRMKLRWQASHEGTWHTRAKAIQDALAQRLTNAGAATSRAGMAACSCASPMRATGS